MTETEKLNNLNKFEYQGQGQFQPKISIGVYLYQVIRAVGPLTRSEMMHLTKIPWTTLYDALTRLILENRIRKYPIIVQKRGRPQVLYEIIE